MEYLVLFFEGIVSAINPCVLPILPLYLGYLSQNAKSVDEHGVTTYSKTKVMMYTLTFILGITMTFFVLAFAIGGLVDLLIDYQIELMILGGVFVALMGLMQMNVIQIPFLMRDVRVNKRFDLNNMNLFSAFLMGFLFSFSWTPCIGPALSGVLVIAATSGAQGTLMILVYALGFLIPFLMLGLFMQTAMKFFKEKQAWVKNLVKVGGLALLLVGGFMVSEGFSIIRTQVASTSSEEDLLYFTLEDQYGNEHSLSDYEGKKVIVNFFATWCHYCNLEIPFLNEVSTERDDVVVLGVIQPGNGDLSKEEIIAWVEENEIEYPVLIDESGLVSRTYGIQAFPKNVFLFSDNEIYGAVDGFLDKDALTSILNDMY